MTTGTLPTEVETYLATVRDELRDLPTGERDDLLAEVEASLFDAATEAEGTLAARLGPPEAFAAELRAAAGLHDVQPAAPTRALDDLRAALERVAADRRVRAVHGTLSELAPIWWVARGWLVVATFAFATDAEWMWSLPVVPRFGTAVAGLAAIVVAALVSVAVGLGARRAGVGRRALAFANAAIVLAAVPALTEIWDRRSAAPTQIVTVQAIQAGLAYNGQPVQNIYPYSRDGRLLLDVLLYDGAGVPIDIGADAVDPTRRLLRTPDGKPIFNSFPIRYVEPDTQEVERPEAAPPVEIPEIATPALRRGSDR